MRRLMSQGGAVVLLVAVAAPAVATAGDPFTRTWSRVDVDGSRETLTFGGTADAKTYAYVDERATTCGGGRYEISGSVLVDGNVATLDGAGGCVGDPAMPAGGTLTYDASGQTIDDGSGLPWLRGNGAREAFLGTWLATDIDGSAMKLTFKGEGLGRDVTYVDSVATSCDPDVAFRSEGVGTIGSTSGWGRYIQVSLEGGCIGGDAFAYDEVYRYDVGTDTLSGPLDGDGNPQAYTVDWHRG